MPYSQFAIRRRNRQVTKRQYYLLIFLTAIAALAINIIGMLPMEASTAEIIIPKKVETVLVPVVKNTKDIKGTIREVSAYNSVPEQTDGSPCIAADGSDVCKRYAAGECIVAANFAKLGSKIHVDNFGICTVADRMNKRYQNSVDVFMGNDVARAINFGRQKLLVKDL